MNEVSLINKTVDIVVTGIDTLIDKYIFFLKQRFGKPKHLWSQTILVHLIASLVWFSVIFLCTLTWKDVVYVFDIPWQDSAIRTVFNKYILYYPVILFNIYYLIPKLWRQKRYIFYLLSILIVAIYCMLLNNTWLIKAEDNHENWEVQYLVQLLSVIVVFVISGLIQYVYEELAVSARTIVLERQKMRLALEKNDLELNNIKLRVAQLKPHFLLNALNNIDTLLLLQRTDAAAKSLQNLSGILKYLLYDSDKKSISLSDEIQHIESLIQLENLRFRNPPRIDLQLSGNIDEVQIPPLLLTPLVENAFKHFDPNDRWIRINVEIFLNHISITIENSQSPHTTTAKTDYGGLGIKRLEERLHNLYPQYKNLLKINTTYDTIFGIVLTIPI